ncbi:MAG TPA: hypothetical protein PKH64_08340 [Petrotogaceae bacterium]|nr:hypothetical protein [Petrotogaceae bacterium]HPX15036.1 hypothetical protein [Petrotogaceae bacterium]HQC40841.1 hypothetical protein [Petrotogaceae bacterium]
MARVYGIKKKLALNNVDEKTIKEIIGNEDLVDVIGRMENLIDSDMMHEILDSCACGGGQEFLNQCKKIGKDLAGKTLDEKIDYLNNYIFHSEKIILNRNNLLTGTFLYKENEKYKCACSAAVKKGMMVYDLTENTDNRTMPLSYCFCCAGSFRRHLQLQLGIELKTKKIVSSPINSRGQKPCEFIFEIL